MVDKKGTMINIVLFIFNIRVKMIKLPKKKEKKGGGKGRERRNKNMQITKKEISLFILATNIFKKGINTNKKLGINVC